VKYVLMIYGNREYWEAVPKSEFARIIEIHDAFQKRIKDSGEFVSAVGLEFEDAAKTVFVNNGAIEVTDGPFLESKEYLCSYYIVDVESLDRAIELAAELPAAGMNGVRVWPVYEAAPDTTQEVNLVAGHEIPPASG
jgi:hypothetical protein